MDASAAAPLLLSVENYLRGEADGHVRHEFIGGRTYAMAGGSERHNAIAGNLFAALHAHVRGGPCRAYMADFKVRLEINREDLFYYPDVMVACQRVGVEQYYLRYPTIVAEVLSPSTEMTDRREKLLNYPQISTLEEYVLIEQEKCEITLHRRSDGWKPHLRTRAEETLELASIKFALPVARIYEGTGI